MIPLSVVVPTHGRVDLVAETIDSLRRQTLDTFELVVTDDSPSPADREAIDATVRAYAAATGRRASYLFTTPRLGQARNTNQGLRAARGTFVRILHSDDLLSPAALESELDVLHDRRFGARMLFHHVEPFVRAPRFTGTPSLSLVQPSLLVRSMLHSGTPLPSATVVARTLLDDIGGGMREDFDFLCDWDFALRLIVAEHRRHGAIALVTPGFVGWRLHPDSTTGRLWHRHFLEHEQLMGELACDTALAESLIGDRRARDMFFAAAVRYRYRRLASDVAGMGGRQAVRALPRIGRCVLSPASVTARLTPGPTSWLGRRRYPDLEITTSATDDADRAAAAWRQEPRRGLAATLTAYAANAIIRLGKRYVAKAVLASADPATPLPAGPAVLRVGDTVEIRSGMDGGPAAPGHVLVLTEFNNSMNLWPVRGLIADTRHVILSRLNANAFVEPVLHESVKYTAPGTTLDVPLTDNRHLTGFGFKALIDKLAPGEFEWVDQATSGPTHRLSYRRRMRGHPAYETLHTGWTFGLLTTGTRLANVERFVDSIGAFCPEPHEILIVSPVELGDLERRPNVRVLRFNEHDARGWITRKKNLVCEAARFSDILVCHDRFMLTPDFCRSFDAWGYAYGLAAPRVRLADGSRALDWAVVSSQNHVWSAGGLLDYRAYSQYAYNPGGATIIRRAFWQDFPWNENLFWNEHEDVELCRRIQRAGGIIALADATLLAAEDRWVHHNPLIPYCEHNEVLYGRPVGEQRIRFLRQGAA